MSKLFGTDGIRGKAGEFPLDPETVGSIGYSLANHLSEGKDELRLIVGRDTRWSGPEIEKTLIGGAIAAGAKCESAGVITTPGVAFLTADQKFDAGIVISASHNPCDDNGLKVFLPSGQKLPADIEGKIETDIAANSSQFTAVEVEFDSGREVEFQDRYLEHFKKDFAELDLSGLRVVADCAHGAASGLAPRLFEDLGADVISINNDPDGRNINLNCGSLHLEVLQESVAENNADFGVAFDGDADRSLFVDEKGSIVDGDATLWIMARLLDQQDMLEQKTVVATVMSNIGLERALSSKGFKLIRTSVGDKYVLRALIDGGFSVGGEQSGHIIFPRRSLIGDGMQTALFILDAMTRNGQPLSGLTEGFTKYPQVLVNTKVTVKKPFDSVPQIVEAKERIEADLGQNGRLLLRYSGTENLARVMIEGEDQNAIEELANDLASVIAKSLS